METTQKQSEGVRTRPGVSIPLSNEIAAVFLGRSLAHPDTLPKARAEAEKRLAQFENFNVTYAQNTADELNVVVPDFPDWDHKIDQITEEQLAEIAGGELFVTVGVVGAFFAKIGIMLSVGSGILGTGAAGASIASASAIAAGVAASALVVGAGVLGTSVVATGLGVGIAAGLGAFDGNQAVSVGHSS